MIRAVLFDLDGTLLDIDLESFLRDYFALLGPVMAEMLGEGATVQDALAAVIAGTEAMSEPHDGLTNREVFNERFFSITGVDLMLPEMSAFISRFYSETFPRLRGAHGPRDGAMRAVAAARQTGCRVALATNPIFPIEAIGERAGWAGFALGEFDCVTSYESMTACKPSPRYFRSIAESLGVETGECVMVGDDPVLDLAAADVGMRTFYVGEGGPVVSDWSGSLDDFAELLPRLAGE